LWVSFKNRLNLKLVSLVELSSFDAIALPATAGQKAEQELEESASFKA
jgi:hypothetical protein